MWLKVLFTAGGFMTGILISLGILNILLKDKTAEELRNNRSLQRRYGPIGWLIALIGAYIGYRLSARM